MPSPTAPLRPVMCLVSDSVFAFELSPSLTHPQPWALPPATGSVPHLSLEAYEDKSIRVGCRSAGWYPQPEVLWKDPSGQHLPSVSQKHSSDERGLFDIEDVVVVTANRHGKWSCVVRNSRLNKELESSLHISGARTAGSPCGAGSGAGGRCLASSSFDLGFLAQHAGWGGTGGVCASRLVLVHEIT